ncbi:MAG: hypothetical protein HYZ34_01605 [Ignavibacteriae bacterium]|nr:hypothetical protein [Ignavibacteriota bacterium]
MSQSIIGLQSKNIGRRYLASPGYQLQTVNVDTISIGLYKDQPLPYLKSSTVSFYPVAQGEDLRRHPYNLFVATFQADSLHENTVLEKVEKDNKELREQLAIVENNSKSEIDFLQKKIINLKSDIDMLKKLAIFQEDIARQENLRRAKSIQDNNSKLILLELYQTNELSLSQLQRRVLNRMKILSYVFDLFTSGLIKANGLSLSITHTGRSILHKLGLVSNGS